MWGLLSFIFWWGRGVSYIKPSAPKPTIPTLFFSEAAKLRVRVWAAVNELGGLPVAESRKGLPF